MSTGENNCVVRDGRYLFCILAVLASGLVTACGAPRGEVPAPTTMSPLATDTRATELPRPAAIAYTPTSPPGPVPTITTLPSERIGAAPTATQSAVPVAPPTATTIPPTMLLPGLTPTIPLLTASSTLSAATATAGPTACRLGTGLREETGPILEKYGGLSGLVMCATVGVAETHFPRLQGGIRVLGAPSLQVLEQKAQRAQESGLPYEALGYGLETGESTPDQEWQDVVGATRQARSIADRYGKLLAMGPGFRLMSQNWDKYPEMAQMADIWILQTQRLQVNPPGPIYRQEVEKVVEQIRSGNPNILIWAQITLPPDREPSVEYWVPYHESIADIVEGTYLGVYTWKSADPDQLVQTIDAIIATVCGDAQ